MLSKSQKVLQIYAIDDKKVVFVQEMDDYPGRFEASAIILIDTWREMHMPGTITMTIEPGDRLNVV